MNIEKTEKIACVFIGRSGCGKGTQAKLFIEKLKEASSQPIFYLESGEKFRSFIQGGTYSSGLSKKIYDQGTLQPEFLAVWVWSHILVESLKENENLVLDGTPRKVDEARVLETAFDFYGYKKVYVFHINISREESKKRLALRGRIDDKDPEEVEKRLDWYERDVLPAIDFYRNNPRYKFLEINGEQVPEAVHEELVKSF